MTKLRDDLMRDEGLRLKPYKCTAGRWTIGYGRNLEDRGITEKEALVLLENDILQVHRDLDMHLSWWRSMPEPQQRALANMAFQLGLGGVLKFTKTLAFLKAGDYAAAADEMLHSRWAGQTPERARRVADLMRSGE